ncbi:hypothetical protein D0469_00985 [Peribacillus saganii]|uniref:YaaC-like protein n=1 Tax=Peribacillus saganii TaxID=2303992 RepID=A0A372LTI1_9BACI|nr:YaaC family protein [Peribacillus saganii]RFU71521.1 hypothetical protein D0469_00985 [Peribacillus saganii]
MSNHFKQKTWDKFTLFFSASFSQSYLNKCYQKESITEKDTKSYENCYPFLYYLEHSKTYYDQAAIAPPSIQPILAFYGFTQLLKACLLTVDPVYPESTSVLAHGVTTRKRKKQQYEFLSDEIKIQKHGLFTHFAEKMFHMKHLDGEKFSMRDLLKELPEMSQPFEFLTLTKNFKKLDYQNGEYHLPISILNRFHMTSNRFNDYLKSKVPMEIELKEGPTLSLLFDGKLSCNNNAPFRKDINSDSFMLSLNKDSPCYALPELIIHYLVLYNLSMIARYETEWWSELIKSMANNDYPFIMQFLTITLEKGPYLILKWLTEDKFSND